MKRLGAIAGLAMIALLASWAVVGTRGGDTAAAADPGVLGLPRQAWNDAFGDGFATDDGYFSYLADDGSTYYIGFDANDATTFVEWIPPSGFLPFVDAESFVAGLLPVDAVLVEEFAEVSVSAGDRETVQLYRSDTITGTYVDATGASGFILVGYGRNGSGSDVTRISVGVGNEG